MMDAIPQIEELYRYNDWANSRVFEITYGLSNEQMDQQRELGLGSLRSTLFHILAAEQIWLERWQVAPWRPFPINSMGMAVEEIEAQLRQVSQARQQMMKSERSSRWQRIVNYKDGRGNEHSNPLDVLLLHVVNHSVYHRAQALAYLKSFGRTLPIGIDYMMYKLARPSLDQLPESNKKFAEMGLMVNKSPGWIPNWDGQLMARYFEYSQWAYRQLIDLAKNLDNAALDRDHGIGHGSIRKSLGHLLTVESRYQAILQNKLESWQAPEANDVLKMGEQLDHFQVENLELAKSLDDKAAQKTIKFSPGGSVFEARIVEALNQVCTHATHHRAQIVNMLRHSGHTVPASDLIAWWRQRA